jgi:type I restriction enzyme S subunit
MGNYQGYQKYQDSGVKWLGEIPEHWEQKRFKFSVNLINNKIEAENSNLSYMGLEHIESWTGKKIEDKNASSEGIGSHFLPNDVLFGKLRPYLAKVYLSDIEGLASTEALVLRCKNNIFPKFLKYYILSRDFINIVDSSTFGAKMPRASWDFIGNLFFIFPPLNEQQKIAQFLDYKTKQIDELIRKKETLIEKLNEKRTALISHAVTKGLDSSVPMKDSGIEWLGNIPKHWTILKLGRLCDVTKLTGFEYTKKWETDPNGEIIALRGFNIKNNQLILNDVERITSELSNELLRSKLYAGDIVFPCTGTLGEGAIIDDDNKYHINQNIAKISPVKNIDRKFLLLSLCSKNMKYQIELYNSSGLQPVLLIGTIRSLIISIPDFLEQKQIAQYLDKKTAQIDLQKAKIKQAIELLKEYRTSLITNAVTGKIDVRQVDIS